MVSDTKIIRSNSFNAGEITAYPPVGTQQVSFQPNRVEFPKRKTRTDLVDISTEGRQAQTQLDIENLLQNIKQKNPNELSPQEKKLLSNPSLANQRTVNKEQRRQSAVGNADSSYPSLNQNSTMVEGALPSTGRDSRTDNLSNSLGLQSVEPNTLQAENGMGFDGPFSLEIAPLTAQRESMAVRAMAELHPRTASRTGLNVSPRKEAIYPLNTSTNEPMWVNIFA
jgi:hypothetical protein